MEDEAIAPNTYRYRIAEADPVGMGRKSRQYLHNVPT